MKGKKIVLFLILSCCVTTVVLAQTGVKKRRALPHEYGRVVMNTVAERAGLPAVEFEHWFHRMKYTCRLCHVDLAFAMKAGDTGVRAADNARGFYCGACHNGKPDASGEKIFEACRVDAARDERGRCQRCHSSGRDVKREHEFYAVTGKFPRGRFGNGIDWMKAEENGLIKLVDELPGISIPRQHLAVQRDFTLTGTIAGMPDIIFSHKKHTAWNGCEVCHPEIFIGVKRGKTKYSMEEIYARKYCGVCHISVAFPVIDCQRCHAQPAQST